MAEIYLAFDVKLKRQVALKVLRETDSDSPNRMRRFIQEAHAASALNHPNVTHIYEIEEANGVNFIAMEYVVGETLRERLRKRRVTATEAIEIGYSVAGALRAAHDLGIVHRDIKPENIMIMAEGFVKVLDFGLAKLTDLKSLQSNSTISQNLSHPGMMLGTINYMSPEQVRGKPVDARTDIWSLGVVLYEMIAGRPPFEYETASDVIAAILSQSPPPIESFSHESPRSIEELIFKALVKDRDQRYQTIRELQTDLGKLRHHSETSSESAVMSDAIGGLGSNERKAGTPPTGDSAAQPTATDGIGLSPFREKHFIDTFRRHKTTSLALMVLIAIAVAAGVYTFRSLSNRSTEKPSRRLKRMTFESGLQDSPTWSPDGKFIAYSSDRGGNFDIWVQSISGGESIRLASSEEHEWQPNWSPDANWIVFRSERDGGGIYRIPAPFGGQMEKISSFGYNPQWSPDGKRLLFLRPGMRLYHRPRVYVVNADGSNSHEVLKFVGGDEKGIKRGMPVWHPDGQRVSFWNEDGTFLTAPIDDGTPLKSEIDDMVSARLKEANLSLGSFSWAPSGKVIYFEGRSQGVLNLWRISVDPKTLRWVDGPERLTYSDGQDVNIALSRDGRRLAYTKKNQSTSVWLLPFDPRRGMITGAGKPVTANDMDAWFPDLSPDGRKLLFSVYKQGMIKQELWEKVLDTNEDRKITEIEGSLPFSPRWATDSKLIAYSRISATNPEGTSEAGFIILLDPSTGFEQPLASPPPHGQQTWDYTYDWSPDGQWVLGSTDRGSPERWYIVKFPMAEAPHAELKMQEVARDPESNLWAPRFSPDGRWITFLKQNPNKVASSVLQVVSESGGVPIAVTEDKYWADKPRWSPDGKTIYFIYNRNSYFLNIWGVRFDPAQGKPIGEPFRVTNFTSPNKMVSTMLSYMEISLSKNQLAVPITESTGNIWVLENVEP